MILNVHYGFIVWSFKKAIRNHEEQNIPRVSIVVSTSLLSVAYIK